MDKKPNILVIMTDQHSRNFLGSYGNKLVRTPNLDRLAAQGIRFTDTYCPAPLCVPSRMSFMSCQTPSANQVWNNDHILNSNIPTWPAWLTLAGYETLLFGRMHFDGPDQLHGFESRPVAEGDAGPVGMPIKGGPLWTRFPPSTTAQSRECVEIAGRGNTLYQWGDLERVRVAREWLRARAAKSEERPFAAVVGLALPHCPFIAPPELFNYYYDKVDIPCIEDHQPATISRFRELRGILEPPLPEKRIRVARAAYYALCEQVDGLIGEILKTLETTGLAENTIVFYVSDHGEMAGEHGCWWKSNYYEGSAGVPMIVRWPGVVPRGTVSSAVTNLMDIGPTLAGIAGAPIPYPVTGRSMLRILQHGSDSEWVNETFCELIDHRGGSPLPSRMIRSGHWKLWQFADDANLPPTLFNLAEDPEELHDLADDPGHTQIRDTLLSRINRDWKPEEAACQSQRLRDYYRFLLKIGEATKPDSPYALVYPPASYEDNVELL